MRRLITDDSGDVSMKRWPARKAVLTRDSMLQFARHDSSSIARRPPTGLKRVDARIDGNRQVGSSLPADGWQPALQEDSTAARNQDAGLTRNKPSGSRLQP